MENHSPVHDMPASSAWVSAYEMDERVGADADLRQIMGEWFARATAGLPDRGAPWMRRGWFVEALAWTVARLREADAVPQGPPEQLRAWERSYLMRIRTDRGVFYFKAAPSVFRHEAPLSRWLEQQFPFNVPHVVAIDEQRHWFLLQEVRGVTEPLQEVREEALWEAAVRRLAEMQISSVARVPELRALGVPDRSLEVLARRIPRLCGDASAMMLGSPCGLSRREIERIAALGPSLLALTGKLAHLDIPLTLEHGDLLSSNILMTLDGPVFLDWSDSSLSHPFFTLFHLVNEAASLLPTSSAESRRRLRDAYLAPWQAIAPMDQLVRAYEIAHMLAPIHLAAITHAELAPAAGYRWEIECTIPAHLRSALDMLLLEN